MIEKTEEATALFARRPARIRLAFAAILALACPTPSARSQQGQEQQGVDQGDYNIRQSVEFGGRFTSLGGDLQAYNTFVNLQQGPRLLGFTMEIRSLNHHASLFDRLYLSNFGYGGDPNNVSRLRMSKNKWYNFDALFRRDENFWDYSLQANPLNPTAPAFANAPASFMPSINLSPHLLNTRRKLGDYSFLFLPQSRLRLRLGYARNINEGPTFSTIHQGTEQLLFQDWKTTVNTYRLGADFQALPRTNISYDEIWNYYKGDSGAIDYLQMPTGTSAPMPLNGNPTVFLSNGTPVDIGISLNAGANQPCPNTFGGPPAGAVNPACSTYFNYLTHGRVRTSAPTEQISLQSNYWKEFDISARFGYTGGDAKEFGYLESVFGRESRTNLRNGLTNGSVFGRRVVATSDFSVSWHITDSFNFLDSFHFSNFHNPMEFDSLLCSFFSTNLLTPANIFTPTATVPLNCAAPGDGLAGTPAHSASSGPDVSVAAYSSFLKVDEKTNLTELDYQFSHRFGVRVGFRYRGRTETEEALHAVTEVFSPDNANRGDCALLGGVLPPGCTANGDGSFMFVTPDLTPDIGSTPIHEYAGLFGVWGQPVKKWRISFDTELMSADTAFTRISPRQTQEYRIRSTYKPSSWMNVSGSLHIWEGRDNVAEVGNLQHDRAYGFSAFFQPNDKFALELGYDYNDVFSQVLICYVSSTAPAGLAKCPGSTVLVEQLSRYRNKAHYGNFDVMWMPFRKLTTHLGANLTGTSGSAILLNPNAVPGPLDSKYLRPYGGLDYALAKNWTGKAYWGYYGYHEDGTTLAQDLLAPRNFHGNLMTLSMRYAF